MSDLNENDDLLNYEIGELDDHVLAGDEDELLLSDEESAATKELLLPEAEEWIQSKLNKNEKKVVNLNSSIESDSEVSLKINLDSSCFSGTDYTGQTSETETDTKDECESDITTSETVPSSKSVVENVIHKSGEEVTSSETESVEISSPAVQAESVDSLVSVQQPQSSDRDDTLELDCGQFDGDEDGEEENERFNPKQSVERENNVRFQRPMRGMMSQRGNRLYGPRPSFPPGHPYNKNENYNPHSFHSVPPPNQIMPQQPNMYQPNFRHPHPNNMRPPPQQQQQPPPHYNMYRGTRPDLIQNMGGNGPPFRQFNPNMVRGSMPGQFDQMRPRMMVSGQQFHNQGPPQQRPQFIGGGPIHRMGVGPQMSHQIPQSSSVGMLQPTVLSRKVLINPNFKGGVEAATNQLMMDTLNSKAQYGSSIDTHSHDDDELLRQQEEFINRNRQHIEKRRHERSPDRDREYSPPRRERRAFSRERDSGFRNYRGKT